MAQLYLKGVYFDTESEGLWYIDNAGSYQEITVGGTTIYTGDGSLSGDRTVDLNGHLLAFQDLASNPNGQLQLNATNTWIGNVISPSLTYSLELLTSGLIFLGADGGNNSSIQINDASKTITSSLGGDGNSQATIEIASATDEQVFFDLKAQSDSDPVVQIKGDAIANSLIYTADTHTFNVGITITELAGVGTRAIAVDANGKIVLL